MLILAGVAFAIAWYLAVATGYQLKKSEDTGNLDGLFILFALSLIHISLGVWLVS